MNATPGPWKLRQSDELPWVIEGREGRDGFPVAVLTGLRQPAEANALLIAAAPELLAALIELMSAEHPPFRGPLQYDSAREDAWDHARAAVAKAAPARARMAGHD